MLATLLPPSTISAVTTSDEIEALEPAVIAFAEATGLLGPPREIAAWITDMLRYRRAPHQARLLLRAAEKVRASGLPPAGVEDRLLRAVLEEGAFEDDPNMQERWANLLANGVVGAGRVKAAYPRILAELEPSEARLLDELVQSCSFPELGLNAHFDTLEWMRGDFGYDSLDNLVRLGIFQFTSHLTNEVDRPTDEKGVRFTDLGWEFVLACRDLDAFPLPRVEQWRWPATSPPFHPRPRAGEPAPSDQR